MSVLSDSLPAQRADLRVPHAEAPIGYAQVSVSIVRLRREVLEAGRRDVRSQSDDPRPISSVELACWAGDPTRRH